MKSFLLAAAVLLLISCESAQFEGTGYGESVTLTKSTQISEILDNPSDFLGERVLVEGTVVGVCESMGCWMDIASDREFEKIQIKVDDGVMIFPLSARGHEARVEGIVEELQYTEEQALEQARHMAEERGEEFDPSTITGPQTIYRIRGIGAIIAD